MTDQKQLREAIEQAHRTEKALGARRWDEAFQAASDGAISVICRALEDALPEPNDHVVIGIRDNEPFFYSHMGTPFMCASTAKEVERNANKNFWPRIRYTAVKVRHE